MVRAVRGDLDDLSAQPLDKGRVFAHRVHHDNPVTGGKEHVHKLPLCGKGFAGARHAEEQAVGIFEFLPVRHNDVMGKSVEPVIDGLAVHAELLRHKGNENSRGAGGHAALDLNAVMAQRQAGKKTVLLLEVQPLQGAVVFLNDTRHREQVIVQLPTGRSHVHHKEGQQEHSLVPALQIFQEGLCVVAVRHKVGREYVHVISGPGCLLLFLHLHLVNVGDFGLDGFHGGGLIDGLDMERDRHFRIHFQKLRQQLVRKLRGQNLQIGGRAPGRPHPEQAAETEVKAVRGDKVLCGKAGLGYHIPRKPERVGAAGVELPVKELQPFQPREGAALDAQLFEVTANVRLHTLQPRPCGGEVVHVHTEGQELCADNAVVAFGDLVLQHFHILTPDAVVVVLLHGDVDAVPAARAAPMVEERKLKRQGAVKVVQTGAPPVKDGRLIFGLGELVVDVLIFNGFGVIAVLHPAHPIPVHFPVREGLLGGGGNVLSLCEQAKKARLVRLFACGLSGPAVVLQSAAPPFWRQAAHRSFRFCKAAPGDRGTGCG